MDEIDPKNKAVDECDESDRLPAPLRLFRGSGGGIESWLNENTPANVIERLGNIDSEPLSFEYLNQLLILSHEAGLSRGFYEYYWLSLPSSEHPHPYDVTALAGYSDQFASTEGKIVSAEHLAWGLERLYVDGLLFFGNVRECYRKLRNMRFADLQSHFQRKCYDTELLTRRGPSLPLNNIPRDSRYLIAEVACKTYDAPAFSDLRSFLRSRFETLKQKNYRPLPSWHEGWPGHGGR